MIYAKEAETYVAGASMWNRTLAAEALRVVEPADFMDPRCRDVMYVVASLFREGSEITPITVMDALRSEGRLQTGVDSAYLIGLLDDAGSCHAVPDHAEIVLNRAYARALQKAVQPDPQAMDAEEIEQAAERTDGLLRRLRTVREEEPTALLAETTHSDLEAIEQAGKSEGIIGIRSGIPKLDAITHGWRPGQLVIVGAPTGHGKTSLMLRFATIAAREGHRTVYFSLEMPGAELRHRIYAQETSSSLSEIRTGRVDWESLSKVGEMVREWPMAVAARGGMKVSDIAAESRIEKGRLGGLDLIVVDYLQIVRPADKAQRYEQVSAIARDLKMLASQLGVTVIAGAQLNREIEKRKDRTPMLSDLRESGDIENNADIILLGNWPWKYEDRGANDARRTYYELIVAKHRQGEADRKIVCSFDAPKNLITERQAL